METPIVQTKQGRLKGQASKTINNFKFYVFKGIPYAKPPVGDLRFSVTQPPDSWVGIRDATKICNICVQLNRKTKEIVGDEDCLYLNVYTPKLPITKSELLPVMVYFHGGGFAFGQGTNVSTHGPDYLIDKDVVMVSFNYRLGILGFLCLDRKDAPGNMGLRDQVQALKWIKDNIANFNGNPNNVTLFGISAGAASVEYQILSPMAKDLFHRAIAESGSTLLPWAQNNDIRSLALKIPSLNGKNIINDDELLQYLKDLPANELVACSLKVLADFQYPGLIHFGFVPTIEKPRDWEPFLSTPPYLLLKKGEFNKVPYISGFSTQEGLISLILALPKYEKLVNEKSLIDFLTFEINDEERSMLEQKLKVIYLKKRSIDEDSDAFALEFFTDCEFLGGIYMAAKLIAKHNASVYLYEFSYDGGLNNVKKINNIDRKGACHGDIDGYIIKSDPLPHCITDSDRVVRETITTMWTNFAKYGDPTPDMEKVITTEWEPLGATEMECLVIDKTTKMKYLVYPQRIKLFEEMYTQMHCKCKCHLK